MFRVACVDVPALPLQILLRRHPDWKALPVAVVDRDKPLGTITHVNESTRSFRILPGMRYGTALGLSSDLRAGVVGQGEIAAQIGRLTRWLWRFSPRVEPSAREPGVFWLDASGLEPLYATLESWAHELRDNLRQAGLASTVAIGFSRFGAYAAARATSGVVVFRDVSDERARVRSVPIDRLGFDPRLRDKLAKLAIRSVGAFVDLPSRGLRTRFGPDAHALHEMARGSGWEPLDPVPYTEPIHRTIAFDRAESDLERMLARIGPQLVAAIETLAARDEAATSLTIAFTLDDRTACRERVTPAAPTLDRKQIMMLLRLRLEARVFAAGVVEIGVTVRSAPATRRQLELFREKPRRDPEAIQRAFAKIRADLGDDAVVRAHLTDGHLPEARFEWRPIDALPEPRPSDGAAPVLVRRIHTPPIPLPPRARHEPDGWVVARLADGPVEEVVGPHIVSGGWWMREVSRAYHYVRTRSGRWLWIYHDRRRRRWFLHAEVE